MRNATVTFVCLIVVVFALAPGVVGAEIEHNKVIVAATNDEWTRTAIKLEPGDIVIILSDGAIKIGEWAGEVDANGDGTKTGGLYAKVGTGAGFFVGASYVLKSHTAGTLKLRVEDQRYSDNSGMFEVTVLRIPVSAIPEPTVVEAD